MDVRRRLIQIVIEPVAEQKVGVAPPPEEYLILRVVVPEIIAGHFDIQSLVLVAEIFRRKSALVIFLMAENEYLSSVLGRQDMGTCLSRIRQYPELGFICYILSPGLLS